MAMQLGGKGAAFIEMNVVPLIDILLVLLVIFMSMPPDKGLEVLVPQPAVDSPPPPPEGVVVVQVESSGDLKLNQQPVAWDQLSDRLAQIFKERATKVAFIRGDAPVEFAQVARVVDIMHSTGITVGLLTPGLEQSR